MPSSNDIKPPERRAIVVSIVSGKGGCGKTLLTAVLGSALARESLRVLLVDMDIFVRGLTILLTTYRSKASSEKGFTVSDLLGAATDGESSKDNSPQVIRFLDCDVIPACQGVADPLDYDEKQLSSFEFAQHVVEQLLNRVGSEYDLVLLDNRAGIDSLVVAACSNSDVVISVAEDDDVCLQANTNLVNHLRYRMDIKNVFTIINKGRRLTSSDDIETTFGRRPDLNYAGVIPFDMDVLEDFGKSRLWTSIFESLYFRSAIEAWNYVGQFSHSQVPSIKASRYHFPSRIYGTSGSGRLNLSQRLMRLYGVAAVMGGLAMLFYAIFRERLTVGAYELMSLATVLLGFLMMFLSTVSFRRWILGSSDRPHSATSRER